MPMLCHGGSRIEWFNVSAACCDNARLLPAYRWYPRTLFTTLLLVCAVIVHIFLKVFLPKNSFCVCFQHARQTKHPEEMVRLITLDIPPNSMAEVDDPVEDAALMARIGAKPTGYRSNYVLKNETTGKRFTFGWDQISGRTYWKLLRSRI